MKPGLHKAVHVSRNNKIMILGFWRIVEEEVLQKFSFLQGEYDFTPFETKIFRDEFYIKSRKALIEFSVYFQMESDAYPCISIINHSEEVEFDSTLTPTNLYDIDKLEKNNSIIASMPRTGEEAIRIYITECAEILKRHPQVLFGDVSDFDKKKAFSELRIQVYRMRKDGKVVSNGTRTLKSLSELKNRNWHKENILTKLFARIKSSFK